MCDATQVWGALYLERRRWELPPCRIARLRSADAAGYQRLAKINVGHPVLPGTNQ